jgi:hypothetical protein
MKPIHLFALVTAALAGCISTSFTAMAQNVGELNTVSTSGKQRMHSQRVLKAYSQLGLGIAPEKAGAVLAASLNELKSNNAELRSSAKEPNQAALQSQAALIEKLSEVTSSPPNPASLQRAVQISEELLNNAESLTQGLIKSGNEAPAAMVNLAARQRMLSQRAAGSYLAYQTLKSPELKARALKATADFKIAISAFDDAKAEFPQVADRIEMSRVQMVFFENALNNIDNPTKEQFTTIATTSERILGEMDAMTADIVKQLAARNAAKKK